MIDIFHRYRDAEVGLIVFIPCITAGIAMQQLQEGYYAIRMVRVEIARRLAQAASNS